MSLAILWKWTHTNSRVSHEEANQSRLKTSYAVGIIGKTAKTTKKFRHLSIYE
jgi:hypothetical protein